MHTGFAIQIKVLITCQLRLGANGLIRREQLREWLRMPDSAFEPLTRFIPKKTGISLFGIAKASPFINLLSRTHQTQVTQ